MDAPAPCTIVAGPESKSGGGAFRSVSSRSGATRLSQPGESGGGRTTGPDGGKSAGVGSCSCSLFSGNHCSSSGASAATSSSAGSSSCAAAGAGASFVNQSLSSSEGFAGAFWTGDLNQSLSSSDGGGGSSTGVLNQSLSSSTGAGAASTGGAGGGGGGIGAGGSIGSAAATAPGFASIIQPAASASLGMMAWRASPGSHDIVIGSSSGRSSVGRASTGIQEVGASTFAGGSSFSRGKSGGDAGIPPTDSRSLSGSVLGASRSCSHAHADGFTE